ncbi:MAG TPA: HepT-like ribonuclease domain-containing protein [Nitriliruptorales bacterium]
MSPRSTCDRLRDILDAVDKATAFGQRDRDSMATAAALYELIVIGEAVNALPEDAIAEDPAVPRSAIVGMRNLAAHEYHRVNAAFVWGTVDGDLPPLRKAVTAELTSRGC